MEKEDVTEETEEIISKNNLRSRSNLSSSFRLGRQRSSALVSDSLSGSARFTAYERIFDAESTSFDGDESPLVSDEFKMKYLQKKSTAWGFISKVFWFRKSGDTRDSVGVSGSPRWSE